MSVYGAIAVLTGKKLRARPDQEDSDSSTSLFSQREYQVAQTEAEEPIGPDAKSLIFANLQGDPRLAALWNDMVEEVVEDEVLLAQIENKVLGHVSEVLKSLQRESKDRLMYSPEKANEIIETLLNENSKEKFVLENPKALKGFYSKYFGSVEDVKLSKSTRAGRVLSLYDANSGRGLKDLLEPNELEKPKTNAFVPRACGPVRIIHLEAAALPVLPQQQREDGASAQSEGSVGAGRTPENLFQRATKQLSEAVLKFITMCITASLLSQFGFKQLSQLLVNSYSVRYFNAFKRVARGLFTTSA